MVKKLILVLVLLLAVGFVGVKYYSYIFAKTIKGKVIKVERVNNQGTLITGPGATATQLFSFAVAIEDETGEIHTASSEDRQWAVVQSSQCVEAKYFPYTPWDLDHAGTYHGARLIRLFTCAK